MTGLFRVLIFTGPGTQRVWKVINGRVIGCVVRKEIQQRSLAAAGCTEIQRVTSYRVIRIAKFADILEGALKRWCNSGGRRR